MADSKTGECYELGNSLLICGDSTDPETVRGVMRGEEADLVFTDPPYGMKKEKEGVLNDNLNYNALLEFNKIWIANALEALKDNGSFYCWGIDEPLMDIYSEIVKPLIRAGAVTFRNLITWDKGSGQGQHDACGRMFARADEKCLFFMKGVQGFNNNADNYFEGFEEIRQAIKAHVDKLGLTHGAIAREMGFSSSRTVSHWTDRSQWAMIPPQHWQKLREIGKARGVDSWTDYDEIKKQYDEIKKQYDEIKKEYYSGRAYFDNTWDNFNNVWHDARPTQTERADTGGHATPKPLTLCRRGIMCSSRSGEIVLDLFGGSGSTLIAAEELDRRCRMVEFDPYFCDVIRARWTKWARRNNRPLTSGALDDVGERGEIVEQVEEPLQLSLFDLREGA